MEMPLATVVGYLDQHAGAATALLTAVLVAINAYYAVQNWQLRRDAERGRREAIKPKLALEFHRLAPTVVTLGIRNVGPGVAFGVDVTMTMFPAADGVEPDARRWRKNIIASGEEFDFFPSSDLNDNLNTLPAAYERITLTGSMKDAEGHAHVVEDEVLDLADWRAALREARQRFTRPDPEGRLEEELGRPIKDTGKTLGTKLDSIVRALYALAPPKQEDD